MASRARPAAPATAAEAAVASAVEALALVVVTLDDAMRARGPDSRAALTMLAKVAAEKATGDLTCAAEAVRKLLQAARQPKRKNGPPVGVADAPAGSVYGFDDLKEE